MPNRRAAWLVGVPCLGIYLYRTGVVVWPHLFSSPGDFGYYHRAAAALLVGQSPFAYAFDYPPLLPILFAPLALLPLDAARMAWFLVSQACLLGAAVCLWRPFGRDLAALAAIAMVWALGGTAPENLSLGQINPLLLLLLAVAFRQNDPRPARAAAALGFAAGLKVWPGLLLATDLAPRRRRALALGLGVASLSLLAPWILLTVLSAPPHLPTSTGYWRGTPAPLNLSLPAAALRATYPLRPKDAALPLDWEVGNNPEQLHLAPWRQGLSVGVAVLSLALGLGALLHRASRTSLAEPRNRLFALSALTALATFASPIAWYHYQLCQFPGLSLLSASYLRRRSLLPVAGLAAR